jgi:CBS domain-containing protein
MNTKLLSRDVMTRNVYYVREDEDLNFAETLSDWKHIRHIPVVDREEKLVGMLSVRDLLKHLSAEGSTKFSKVKTFMATPVVSAAPETPLKDLIQRMQEAEVSAIPIVDCDRVIGIVTEHDLVKVLESMI